MPTITDIRLQNVGASVQTAAPVTLGHAFKKGDLQTSDVLKGVLSDATVVPLQVNVKATHADGSVRHALISLVAPSIPANTTTTVTLQTGGVAPTGTPTIAALISAGFTASVSATIGGTKYSAAADQLLNSGSPTVWFQGGIATEWLTFLPLTTSGGSAHAHLTARFAIRYYPGLQKARVDVTLENNWAYEPGPQNFTYDTEITVGGTVVYSKAAVLHYTHARWRKVFWWGGAAPTINVQHNTAYLIGSKAVPNYDMSFGVQAGILSSYGAAFAAVQDPMSIGIATDYMPSTGAHNDIGILPMWVAAHVLCMDVRARDATLLTADGAGSFGVHYRDKNTGYPVRLLDHPMMTISGHPSDAGADAFPGAGGDTATPLTPDIAHQPSFGYYPYLITGDYYYLEELHFWAFWNLFSANPYYRFGDQGLIIDDQVRGQAWAIRTIAQAAAITPDAHFLKSECVRLLDTNLTWYNNTYSNNPTANKLGAVINGYAIDGGDIKPWMDDFFTSAAGHAYDLGFAKAKTLLDWKSKFSVGRMTAPGYCWMDGSPYILAVRDDANSPIYETFAQMQARTHPDLIGLTCAGPEMAQVLGRPAGDMGNISSGFEGYPSNMQPALAYAVDSGIRNSRAAWNLFMGRLVKPDYSYGSQFSILPRRDISGPLPTVTVSLLTPNGDPAANLTNLKWAWHDQATPNLFSYPVDSGAAASTDADGLLQLTLSNSGLAPGEVGHLEVTNSDGSITGLYGVFYGPWATNL